MFQDRLEEMQNNVALFLQSLKLGETEIGMVEFWEFPNTCVNMTMLDSEENRQKLLNAIPNRLTWGTCIGCGIERALEVWLNFNTLTCPRKIGYWS